MLYDKPAKVSVFSFVCTITVSRCKLNFGRMKWLENGNVYGNKRLACMEMQLDSNADLFVVVRCRMSQAFEM